MLPGPDKHVRRRDNVDERGIRRVAVGHPDGDGELVDSAAKRRRQRAYNAQQQRGEAILERCDSRQPSHHHSHTTTPCAARKNPTVDICPGRKRRILRQRTGDIIIRAFGIVIRLVRVMVVLQLSRGQHRSSCRKSRAEHAADKQTARTESHTTFVSTLQSQFSVRCGTAAMAARSVCDGLGSEQSIDAVHGCRLCASRDLITSEH